MATPRTTSKAAPRSMGTKQGIKSTKLSKASPPRTTRTAAKRGT